MKNTNFQKWLMIILLAIGAGTIFKSLYLREVFYYPWNEFMGVNNTQSGLLMSWLGFTGVLAVFFAGVIVDKINNTRFVIAGTFMIMGLVTLWQSTAPSLVTQYIIIAILSIFANGFFLTSMVRAIRLIGDDKSQGKVFGFLESGRGIAGSLVAIAPIYIFSSAYSNTEGIAAIFYAYGFLYICISIMMWFFIPKDKEISKKQKKIQINEILLIFKIKEIWLVAFAVFATISFHQGSSYLVPYLTDVYGMSTEQAGIIGMIRAYVLAVFLTPIAGILVDKIGSAIRMMQVLFMAGALCTSTFLIVPKEPEVMWFMIIILIAAGSINFALRGIMYAQLEEINVPKHLTGTVTGIILTIGLSPEIFINIIFGYWLETYQLQGYSYMFISMTTLLVLAVLSSIYLYKTASTVFELKG